ncbi:carbohydrate ABC transporter permease [Pseudokineococcus marinus]|uniref:Carbohydrate ABC transporter permease n=1 Tax=Pseudokineococcus marinus TaxID=351215 RepID=A0A849BL45_9ACTN|nr:carbohydrate ABC transporter permease [Pseudokineococcus marinus]NNH21522.1 carbohydrate ABC transporter permease [Pseudokineococcus marinus]
MSLNASLPVPDAARPAGDARRSAPDGGAPAPARRRRRSWGSTAVGVALLAVLLFPLYWMVNVSLQPAGSASRTSWFPSQLSFEGYRTAFEQQSGNLVTSLVVSLGAVALSLVIAAPAAYALAQFRIRYAGVVLFGVLISQMIPGIIVANALYSAYNDLGLLNTVGGLVLADATAGIPFAILILLAFMRSLEPSLVEAARVDGAGPIRAFVSVVLPISRNALITAGLFTFLFAWGDFLFALTLTTTADVRPITLGLYQYIGTYVSDWSTVMATAVMASLPAIALLVLAQRYVAAGVTGGAVK